MHVFIFVDGLVENLLLYCLFRECSFHGKGPLGSTLQATDGSLRFHRTELAGCFQNFFREAHCCAEWFDDPMSNQNISLSRTHRTGRIQDIHELDTSPSIISIPSTSIPGVRTSIFGRPRPLPSDRRADPHYTLTCDEPV